MIDRPARGASPQRSQQQAPQQDTASGARWGRIPAWWLDHPELDADGLAVLAALATYADESGVCWPSQATLAAKLKRSRPTINRILGRLADAGLVAIENRSSASRGRLTCRYRLRLTPEVAEAPIAAQVSAQNINVNTPDSTAHIPCPAASQEQPQPEQIPDSLQGRARRAGYRAGPETGHGGSEVPGDWRPSAEDRAWAAGWAAEHLAGRPLDLDRHAELFATRCRAHGYRYRDIGAAWRSWLIQDMQAELQAGGRQPARHPRTDRPAPPRSRSEEAEQRLSAWAAVAARLQTAPSVPSALTWTRP